MVGFSKTAKSEEAAREIKGKLSIEANMAGVKMGGGAQVEGKFEDKKESILNSFQFTIDGDVQPPDSMPQNMEEAIEYLRQVKQSYI